MAITESGNRRYALIAGSGFAGFGAAESRDGNAGGERPVRRVLTRFGAPSAPVRTADYGDHRVLMLARHGDDIGIAPHRINYRANLAALRMLGANTVIALNTVGVIPSRFTRAILPCRNRFSTTPGVGSIRFTITSQAVDHIDVTRPFGDDLRKALVRAAREAEVECHDGGVYGVTQGPRLESAAEVDRFERDGVDFLGMTAMPEASLARELGLDYACLSLLVNRAAGRGEASIHADIEASTLSAKLQAMRVLKQFFAAET